MELTHLLNWDASHHHLHTKDVAPAPKSWSDMDGTGRVGILRILNLIYYLTYPPSIKSCISPYLLLIFPYL